MKKVIIFKFLPSKKVIFKFLPTWWKRYLKSGKTEVCVHPWFFFGFFFGGDHVFDVVLVFLLLLFILCPVPNVACVLWIVYSWLPLQYSLTFINQILHLWHKWELSQCVCEELKFWDESAQRWQKKETPYSVSAPNFHFLAVGPILTYFFLQIFCSKKEKIC